MTSASYMSTQTCSSMASDKKFEDLNLSQDEVKRLADAMKNEEFRKLLCEYAEEISDPENKKRYEEEIRQMEEERGMDIQFVHPQPGYVIKTTVDGSAKAFINIAKNELIGKPSNEKAVKADGSSGISWQLPHSMAPPREDVDKGGKICTVYDFVIHPDTYRMTETNERFKKMVEETAFDGIEKSFNVQLDRRNLKYPKIEFKGKGQPTVIRSRKDQSSTKKPADQNDPLNKFPYPYDNETTEEKSKRMEEEATRREAASPQKIGSKKEENDGYTEPKYSLRHRCEVDMADFRNAPDANNATRPKDLVIDIELPLCKSAAAVNLDIFEKRLLLEYSKSARYRLDVKLPCKVDENDGSAKFDKNKRILTVTLPVIREVHAVSTPTDRGDFTEESVSNEVDSANEELSALQNNANNGLIEVLSSENFESDLQTEKDVRPKSEAIQLSSENDQTSSENADQPSPISYTFPRYDYSQNHETISFILNIKKTSHESIFKSHSNTCCVLKLTSVGSGGFPIHYSFYVEFPEGCKFEQDNVQVDISDQNVVILFEKCDESIGLWDTFKAGLDPQTSEEKLFLTMSNVKKELDRLDSEQGAMPTAADERENSPELEVTDMDQDKLIVQIKGSENPSRRKKHLSESADDIEVVFEKEVPKIPGILKQRSRTQSESSSEEVFSGVPYNRQSSSTSLSCSNDGSLQESDENNDSGGRKKSVSFSEHIDETSYKSNASVSTLHATLRNKRRKQRKRDQKKEGKQSNRRRTSSCSEPSSDEPGNQFDDLKRCNSLDDLDGNEADSDNPEAENTAGKKETKPQKVSEETTNSDGDSTGKTTDLLRTCDKIEVNDYGTKHGEAKNGEAKHEPQEDGAKTNSGNQISTQENGSNKGKKNNRKGKKGQHGKIDNNASNSGENGDQSKENSDAPTANGSKTGMTNEQHESIDEKDGEKKKNDSVEERKEKDDKPETVLSWEDKKEVYDPLGEHSPKCAVSFSNSVIYDLDVE